MAFPQEYADPGKEFLAVEGFGQIVIGADVQADDLRFDVVLPALSFAITSVMAMRALKASS